MQQPSAPRFEIGEAISQGWRRLWPNVLPMAVYAVIVWLVNVLIQALERDAVGVGRFLASLTALVVGQLVSIGWIKIAIDITDGRPVEAQAVMERFRLIVPYFVAAVLYALMVTVGLVLLVVPGIIVAIFFAFYGFHIIDTGSADPIGALRRSAEITRGHRGRLFLLGLALLGINILGLLVLVVGVIFTSGISLLAVAHVYRKLEPVPIGYAPQGTP